MPSEIPDAVLTQFHDLHAQPFYENVADRQGIRSWIPHIATYYNFTNPDGHNLSHEEVAYLAGMTAQRIEALLADAPQIHRCEDHALHYLYTWRGTERVVNRTAKEIRKEVIMEVVKNFAGTIPEEREPQIPEWIASCQSVQEVLVRAHLEYHLLSWANIQEIEILKEIADLVYKSGLRDSKAYKEVKKRHKTAAHTIDWGQINNFVQTKISPIVQFKDEATKDRCLEAAIIFLINKGAEPDEARTKAERFIDLKK